MRLVNLGGHTEVILLVVLGMVVRRVVELVVLELLVCMALVMEVAGAVVVVGLAVREASQTAVAAAEAQAAAAARYASGLGRNTHLTLTFGSNTWYYGSMKYSVVLRKTKYGYDVHVPALPGCHSQGETQKEALENIKDAIYTYFEMDKKELEGAQVRALEVAL